MSWLQMITKGASAPYVEEAVMDFFTNCALSGNCCVEAEWLFFP